MGHTPLRKRRCQDFDVSGKFAISAAFSVAQAILDIVAAVARIRDVKDSAGAGASGAGKRGGHVRGVAAHPVDGHGAQRELKGEAHEAEPGPVL